MEVYPSVSVVVPTYNRPQALLETVRSLLEQQYAASEIIVVDQSEDVPESVELFFRRDHVVKLRYIRLEQPSLPKARNVGIQQASGDVVLFVDDDVVPLHDDFILRHVVNFTDPRVVGVAGRVIEDGVESHSGPALRVSRWGTISGNPDSTLRTRSDTMKGCNMSFRREAAIRAGLFSNEIIGTAQFEDAEFALRLQKVSGKQIIFDPEAGLHHRRVPTGGCGSRQVSALERHFSRFHNMTVTCLRNPRKINPLFFLMGRMMSAIRIAIRTRNFMALLWLPVAVLHGARTYFRGKVSNETLRYVATRI